MEEGLRDAQLFAVRVVDDHCEDTIHFLTTGTTSKEYSVQQKKELVVCVVNFSIIASHLHKMGNDEILRRYVPEFERGHILAEAHRGLQEDPMQDVQRHKRFFMLVYGGQPYIKIQKHTIGPVMYVNERENHYKWMTCPFNNR